MQINSFSDYSLRILIYLALANDRLVSSREIADRYDISFDHVAKAAQLLSREKFVDAVRGRSGGMRLAREPKDISIGEVLRLTEAGTALVECMRDEPSKCVLAPCCALAPILSDAAEAFYHHLDEKTLADALPKRLQFDEIYKASGETVS